MSFYITKNHNQIIKHAVVVNLGVTMTTLGSFNVHQNLVLVLCATKKSVQLFEKVRQNTKFLTIFQQPFLLFAPLTPHKASTISYNSKKLERRPRRKRLLKGC